MIKYKKPQTFELASHIFLIFISAWISDCIHYKMWDEITYPILTATVEI